MGKGENCNLGPIKHTSVIHDLKFAGKSHYEEQFNEYADKRLFRDTNKKIINYTRELSQPPEPIVMAKPLYYKASKSRRDFNLKKADP